MQLTATNFFCNLLGNAQNQNINLLHFWQKQQQLVIE